MYTSKICHDIVTWIVYQAGTFECQLYSISNSIPDITIQGNATENVE